jgi:hypothetical protein
VIWLPVDYRALDRKVLLLWSTDYSQRHPSCCLALFCSC